MKKEEDEQLEEEQKSEETSLLVAGVDAELDNWLQRLCDIETRFKTCQRKLRVDDVLDEMRRFISPIEFEELKSIGRLWCELVEMIMTYNTGTVKNKRRIIEILITLYSLKQLSTEVLINTIILL